MRVKLCLMGLGSWGKVLYQKAEQLKCCQIRYYYHPVGKKAKKFNQEKGISNLNQALKNVEGVIIATPNDLHFENIKTCLRANKHIFVEKPVTSLYKDALRLKRIIKKDLVFMVGHNQRREGFFRLAKRLIKKDKLGKIVSAYFNVSHGGVFSFSQDQWRHSLKRHREGPLITVGVHLMDTTHYLFGRVDSVYARIKNLSKKTTAPDSNAVILNLKNGASVFIQANYNMPSEELYTIHGTEGTLYINRGRLFLRIGRDKRTGKRFLPSKASEIKLPKTDSIEEELKEFCQAISKGKKVETGLKEGLNALALIEACYQSYKKDKTILMKNFKDYDV